MCPNWGFRYVGYAVSVVAFTAVLLTYLRFSQLRCGNFDILSPTSSHAFPSPTTLHAPCSMLCSVLILIVC